MAVYVLGAGATRGASFVNPKTNPCLPPLDSDFFTQLQRIGNTKHRDTVDRVVRDTAELFGNNFSVTMETVFTTLEHTIRMVEATGEARAFRRRDLVAKRDNLMQAIGALFEESLCSGLEMTPCLHHKKLVSEMRAEDVILSFNYDCLIDDSLRRFGDGRWDAKFGYGLPLRARTPGQTILRGGFLKWSPASPAKRGSGSIKLCKLHGSLHFSLSKKDAQLDLKERPYTKQRGDLRFAIIPPESDKRYDKGFFQGLWRQAREALFRTETLVFIGYSLPATDQHATALFRVAVKGGGLKSLVVVNPDKEARRRIRGVVQRGLDPDTRVYSFDKLEDFACCERTLWDPSVNVANVPPPVVPGCAAAPAAPIQPAGAAVGEPAAQGDVGQG